MKDVICAVFGGREDGSTLKVREDSEMTRYLGYKSIQWQGTPLPPLRCILCLMEYLDCLEYWTVSTSHIGSSLCPPTGHLVKFVTVICCFMASAPCGPNGWLGGGWADFLIFKSSCTSHLLPCKRSKTDILAHCLGKTTNLGGGIGAVLG